MKKKLIIAISVMLTLATLAAFALISGAEDVEPSLSIKYCNLSFEETIHIWYAVDSNLEDEKDVKLLIWTVPQTDGYTKGTENAVLDPQKTKETIDGDEYTVFVYDKLAAKQMTDVVYARAYVEVNGEAYYSPLNKYSILQYAYSKLGKLGGEATSDEDLKEALENMLAFGASTQKYFKYNNTRLANADWYLIKIGGGVLEDGAKHGLYLEDDRITLTANETDSGDFICWKNSSGVAVSNEKKLTLKVGRENETYTAVYSSSTSESGLIFTLSSDGQSYYVSGISENADPNVVIPSIYDGLPVTAIGEGAFKDTSITDVNIPDSVLSIGKDAFSGCTRLKNLIIGDGVTTVGENAFKDTTALVSVIVGDGMTSLDCFDFKYSKCLENIVIGDGIISIGEKTFYSCSNLKSLTIGAKVGTIGSRAFCGCNGLVKVEIPDNVETVSERAFVSCENLEKLVIGNGVKTIEKNAFYSCNKLDDLVIGSNVESIGDYVFYDCKALKKVVIPNSVTTLGRNSFGAYVEDLTLGTGITSVSDTFKNNENIKKVHYTGSIEDWLKIGFEYNYSNPMYSGAALYINGEPLTKLTIPSGTTEIKQYAFYGCTSLTDVVIGDSVTTIGEKAFMSCPNLEDLTIGTGMTKMEKDRFGSAIKKVCYTGTLEGWMKIEFAEGQCNPLCFGAALYIGDELVDKLTIHESVGSVSEYAFYGCGSITKVTALGNTVIGKSAFEGCSSLGEVEIAGNIGESAFKNCEKLSYATLSGSIVGKYAFNSCTALMEIVIEKNVETIGVEAFKGCSVLETITIGAAETRIYGAELSTVESGAFANCPKLDGVVYIGYVKDWAQINFADVTANPLSNKAVLFADTGEGEKRVTAFEVLTVDDKYSIGDYAFAGCKNIIRVVINNADKLGKNVFEGAEIDNVIINDDIDNALFKDCKKLKKIIINDTATAIGADVFSGCSGLEAVDIPNYVISIGSKAFENCTGIKTLTLGDGLTTVADDAFSGCSSVETVVVGNKLTSIGFVCFNGSLKSIKLGDGITVIPSGKFRDYSKLEKVEFGKNVTTIEELAFYGVKTISGEFVIPESVTYIGRQAFTRCTGITDLKIEAAKLEYYAFWYCSGLKSVTFGDKVDYIGVQAFQGCGNLESVVLPKDIEIQTDAFENLTESCVVYYKGTEADWNSLKWIYCPTLKSRTFYYYSETKPTTSGNFWHYVDGVPTVWTVN